MIIHCWMSLSNRTSVFIGVGSQVLRCINWWLTQYGKTEGPSVALSPSDGAQWFLQLLMLNVLSTFLRFDVFLCYWHSKRSHFRRLLFSMRLLWKVRTMLLLSTSCYCFQCLPCCQGSVSVLWVQGSIFQATEEEGLQWRLVGDCSQPTCKIQG